MTSGPTPDASREATSAPLVVRTVALELPADASLIDLLPEDHPVTWLRRGDGLVGCGIGNDELKAITGRWSQRDEDRRIFTDPAVIAEVQKMGVKLIGWKDAREMVRVRTARAE